MQTVTETIIDQGLANRFIKASQLKHLIDGSSERRYGLVNRAMKSGELLQIQRGIYILANRYRPHPFHPFALAQALAPGSYISFETALAYHGWIPERVFTISSIISDRKSRKYENEKLGTYSFHPLAIRPGYFLELVNRIKIDEQTILMARPCRALIDLICLRKIGWKGMGWLSEWLRINPNFISSISRRDLDTLKLVYKHKRVKSFVSSLSVEIDID